MPSKNVSRVSGYWSFISAIGGMNAVCGAVSQGKSTQVSWLTSVTKVSTSGRPSGLA